MILQQLWCLLDWHDWRYIDVYLRRCSCCLSHQHVVFHPGGWRWEEIP